MTDIVLNRGCRYQLQQQLKHAQDASLYCRTLAILELDQGKPVAEVAHGPFYSLSHGCGDFVAVFDSYVADALCWRRHTTARTLLLRLDEKRRDCVPVVVPADTMT